MGAGRKATTHPLKEKVERQWTVNCSVSARNMRKSDLGAVVFGCQHSTLKECKMKNLFGLPLGHFSYVRNVSPGLVLFLFNYSDRKLHGIFEATSPGKLNINPYGWTLDGTEPTPYPAQVRVRVRNQCRPLFEEEFGPIIAENYYEKRHFWFELDRTQTSKLIELFISSTPPNPHFSHRLQNTAAGSMLYNALPIPDTEEFSGHGVKSLVLKDRASNPDEAGTEWDTWEKTAEYFNPEGECSHASVLNGKNNSLPQKSWISLFKASSSSGEVPKDEISKPQTSKRASLSDHSNMKWQASCASSPLHGEDQSFGGCADEWDTDVSELPRRNEIGFIKLKASELGCNHADEPITELELSCATLVSPFGASRDDNATDTTNVAGTCANDSGAQPCDFVSVISQLMQEIEELKGSQLKQNLKISSLEKQLVRSQVEIQDLRKQYKMFGSTPASSSSGHFEEVDLEAYDPFPWSEGSILIVGGYDGSCWLSDFSLYSPTYDLVKNFKPMTFLRSCALATKLNDDLFLLGGVNGETWYDTVESYNFSKNQWLAQPSLNQKKGSLAGVSVYNKLYAIGGGNGINCFSEVEMFDINIGKWIFTKSMLQKRFAPAAATINDALYVVGGYDGAKYLNSVERFDPREPKWTRLQSMSTKRGCHSLVALNEKLYAMGGYDGQKILSSVEIFDPRVCSWMVGEQMKDPRGYSAAVVIGGKIYVIGGLDNKNKILYSIESYEELGCGWQITGLKALGNRSSFSAVVM